MREAVEAGKIRFPPILLTTLYGDRRPAAARVAAEPHSPIANVLIGGLLSSTLLARLVTPVVYVIAPNVEPEDASRTRRKTRIRA